MSPPVALTLRLGHVRELFGPPRFDDLGGSADLPSGVERLVAELLGARPEPGFSVSVVVPAAEWTPELEPRVRAALGQYCDVRLHDVEQRRAALRHEGWVALRTGLPLLVLALTLTALVTHSRLPTLWQTVVGGGVLLVLAWVALWHPLDTLLWYGRPLAHEADALRGLRAAVVRVEGDASPDASGSGRAGASGETRRR